MMYSVPQFIDIEDKVAGFLTGRQLLWLFGFGVLALVLWQFLEFVPFVMAITPIALIFAAFMFYKPQGRPLISYVISAFSFFFRPKLYVWRRMYRKKAKAAAKKKQDQVFDQKQITPEELQEITQMLDTRGGSR